MGSPGTLSGLVLALLLSSAAATDLKRRKIFNWSTYTAFGWALVINSLPLSFRGTGAIGLAASLTGAGVCFGIMLVAYSLARGGAGDVKLAAAIGAIVGVDDGILIIAFSYIIAGIAILGWTVWTLGPLTLCSAMLRRLGAWLLPAYVDALREEQSILLEKPVPLAGFFALGTLCVVFDVPALLRAM